jgi:hypothetical protein
VPVAPKRQETPRSAPAQGVLPAATLAAITAFAARQQIVV